MPPILHRRGTTTPAVLVALLLALAVARPDAARAATTPASPFRMGVTAGSAFTYELPFLTSLGTRTARLIYNIGTTASSMASVMDAYARAGVRPLLVAHFYGRLPSVAEAQNVATWARAYGPGGTFWQGKSYPANTAVNRIEFGHETSYSYQWADNSLSTYAARAKTYALRFKDAQVAVKAVNPSVGLLAQGDNAVNQTAWVTNMLKAVPDLGLRTAGWTIHPYGPNWRARIDSTINSARAAGAPDVPIWVTEWGLTTDNGRCLSDNYGYSKCLTYSQAATTLHAALTGMIAAYGSRINAFYLYQAHDQSATRTQTGREHYFGALQSKGQAKGAYTTEVKADLTRWTW
ncbi:MAG TPA: glycosyl hydrolase [Conexibacter sp.]